MSQITNKANPEIKDFLDKKNAKLTSELVELLAEVIAARREAEAIETEAKTILKEILTPVYFGANEHAQDATEVQHTYDLEDVLQVNFVNSYFFKDDEHLQEVIELLGSKHPLVDTIEQSASLAIDLDDLSEEDRTALVKKVTSVTLDYGIKPKAFTVAKASQDFHDLRHVYLDSDDNLALDEVLPVQVQITPIV